jgi:hypothetical protein
MDINENHITLVFTEFSCTPEEITGILGTEPTKTGVKGQEYYIGPQNNKQCKVWPYNYWALRASKKKSNFISQFVDGFLSEVITPIKEKIKALTAECEAELSIAQYYYSGCNPGLHFTVDNLQLITEIGVELDIDIYCLSESE